MSVNKENKSVTSVVETSKETKLLDQLDVKAEAKPSKNKGFFSRKNIFLIILFFIISVVLIALSVKFLLKTNWAELGTSIKNGFARKIGILWFSLLIVNFLWIVFQNFGLILIRFKQYGIKVSFAEYIVYSFTMAFLRTVVPWVLPDLYNIFWMKTHNIPTHLATSITFNSNFLWEIVQVIVTLPSAIYIFIHARELIYFTNGSLDKEGLTILILICVGMFLNFVSIGFMILFNLSKKLHYSLSMIFNKIKKGLRMKYHTKEEIAEKYKNKAVLKQDFIEFVKNKKAFSLSLLVVMLTELFSYCSLAWSMYFIQQVNIDGITHIVNFNFWKVFNCVNTANTANRINFLPNGAGIEWLISHSVTKLGGWEPISGLTPEQAQPYYEKVTSNGLLIWRAIPIVHAIVGMFCLIELTIPQVKQIKAASKAKTTLII